MSKQQPGRVVADRWQRVWSLAELIVAEPGHSRRELADRMFVSVRQCADDLTNLRRVMGLRLVRQWGGYRLVDERGEPSSGGMTMRDLLTLAAALTVRQENSVRRAAASLVHCAPIHLRPLAHELFSGERRPQFALLANAAMRSQYMRLTVEEKRQRRHVVLVPDLLIQTPLGWTVIGTGRQPSALLAVPLASVAETEPLSLVEMAS